MRDSDNITYLDNILYSNFEFITNIIHIIFPQMERFRIWERRILRSNFAISRNQVEDKTWRLPANSIIYESIDFSNMDKFLMAISLSFPDRAASVNNRLVRESLVHQTD